MPTVDFLLTSSTDTGHKILKFNNSDQQHIKQKQ